MTDDLRARLHATIREWIKGNTSNGSTIELHQRIDAEFDQHSPLPAPCQQGGCQFGRKEQ